MHQEHSVPWNAFASNFQYVHNDKRTPPRTGFAPLNRPTQSKELNYFVDRLTSTIRKFSVTERKKYPPASEITPPKDGLLFSDEILQKYPEYLNTRSQRLDFWIQSSLRDTGFRHSPAYSIYDRDLANVVKTLLHENQMETLLMLASHPHIPFQTLQYLSLGHFHGFFNAIQAALDAYIFWNFASSSGHLASGAYEEISELHRNMVMETVWPTSCDAREIPHEEFYGGYPPSELTDINIPQLHEYLKHLFRLLYRFDMMMRECGMAPEWEREITFIISLRFRFRPDSPGRF